MKIQCFLALGVFCMVLFAGCTTGTPVVERPQTEMPSPAPTLAPAPTSTPIPEEGLTTITFWIPDFLDPYSGESNARSLATQINSFARDNREIQVQTLIKKTEGAGGILDLLTTAAKAAPTVLPDLVIMREVDVQAAARSGVILPLVMTETEALPAAWLPFTESALTVDAQRYGIPYLNQVEHTVYSSSVTTTLPISWTGVLTNGYSMLFPLAASGDLASDAVLTAYLGSGGTIVDEEGKPLLERTYLESLYRFLAVMRDAGLLDAEVATTLSDASSCWTLWRGAETTMTVAPAGEYWTAAERVGRPAFIPTADGSVFSLGRSWALVVVAQEPLRREAALVLAQWLIDPGRVSGLAKDTSLLPSQREALALWPLTPDEIAFLDTLLSRAVPAPSPAIDLAVRRAMQSGLQLLFEGEAVTPEQAAAHALTVLRN
ncbi:MAG: extracellular solute-binding protein [Anaerolineae bacterium]|nr:extracellular solute-binding protein [Anaerolineae bacterium]